MPAIPFRAEVRGSRDLATITLGGDIDVAAEDGLGSAYAEALASGAPVILLDFADVAYVNSTGIALIIRLLAEARRDRRDVRAVGLSPHYAEILRITRITDYLRILDDVTDARGAEG